MLPDEQSIAPALRARMPHGNHKGREARYCEAEACVSHGHADIRAAQ